MPPWPLCPRRTDRVLWCKYLQLILYEEYATRTPVSFSGQGPCQPDEEAVEARIAAGPSSSHGLCQPPRLQRQHSESQVAVHDGDRGRPRLEEHVRTCFEDRAETSGLAAGYRTVRGRFSYRGDRGGPSAPTGSVSQPREYGTSQPPTVMLAAVPSAAWVGRARVSSAAIPSRRRSPTPRGVLQE